jgi:hypothetical protein
LENQPLGVSLITLVILTLGTIAVALRQFGLGNRVWPAQPCHATVVFAAALAICGRLSLSPVAAIEPSSLEDSV